MTSVPFVGLVQAYGTVAQELEPKLLAMMAKGAYPGFPRWIASLMTFLGDFAIRINAIPSSRRVKPVSPCG